METTIQSRPPKFVRWAVLLGIVVVLNLFFFVGRSLVLAEPQYDEFCPMRTTQPVTEAECVKQDGQWVGQTGQVAPDKGTKPVVPDGYCDLNFTCQPQFEIAHKQWAMYSFVIMVGLGVLSLIVGVIPLGSSIVSSGLSYGGVLAFIIASGSYWGEAGNLLKLGISALALVALIYIGIKRFKD